MKPYWLIALLAAPFTQASPDEFEQHAPHEHGRAQLQMVGEHHQLHLALSGAAFNFYGFEHAPTTEQEHRTASHVKALFSQPDKLIHFTGGRCHIESMTPSLPFAGSHAHEDEHHHEHAHKHEHEHHEHGAHHGEHANAGVQYQFHCDALPELSAIELTLFDHFPALEKLHVEALILHHTIATELTPQNRKVSW